MYTVAVIELLMLAVPCLMWLNWVEVRTRGQAKSATLRICIGFGAFFLWMESMAIDAYIHIARYGLCMYVQHYITLERLKYKGQNDSSHP